MRYFGMHVSALGSGEVMSTAALCESNSPLTLTLLADTFGLLGEAAKMCKGD